MTTNAIAVIQARMGSGRLPGKSLLRVAGIPLLLHVISRLRRCTTVRQVVVATTTAPQDDAIADLCAEHGVSVVRGSPDDVLSRFVTAVQRFAPDIVIRVNGDAPFVSWSAIDRLVAALVDDPHADAAAFAPEPPSAHVGFEVVRASLIARLDSQYGHDPAAREHVTGYCNLHPHIARWTRIPVDHRESASHLRLTVDTPADVRLVEAVYAALPATAPWALFADVVALLRTRPDLNAINRHVRQRPTGAQSPTIGFVLDAGPDVGMGHWSRCAVLRGTLIEHYGAAAPAVVRWHGSSAPPWKMEAPGVTVLPPTAHGALTDWLQTHRCDLLVLDVARDIPRPTAHARSGNEVPIALIDDLSTRTDWADLAFYPPIPQVREMTFPPHTRVFAGWNYAIIDAAAFFVQRPISDKRHVLIACGATDPENLAPAIARDLATRSDAVVHVATSGANPRVAEWRRALPPSVILHVDTPLSQLLDKVHLAVLAFGVSAYECAAAHVPSVLLSRDPEAGRVADVFAESGVARHAGRLTDPQAVAAACAAAHSLLDDETARSAMEHSARRLPLDPGGHAVARHLVEYLEETA